MTTSIDKLTRLAGRGPGELEARKPSAPMSVYLLADHLDCALAAGEDLLRQGFSWHAVNPRQASAAEIEREAMRESLQSIRSLELTLMSRVMRAREHAEMLGKRDQRFKLMASLFVSGTVTLLDAVAALGDTTRHNFETGDVATAYLRSRGLLSAEAAAPDEGSIVSVTEEFLVAGRLRAGVLLDMVAMFLDTLETHFDLFATDLPDDTIPGRETPVSLDAGENQDSEGLETVAEPVVAAEPECAPEQESAAGTEAHPAEESAAVEGEDPLAAAVARSSQGDS